MHRKRPFSGKPLLASTLIATLGGVTLAGLLNGCTRQVEIEPLHTLQVSAVYNDEQIQLRFRYPTEQPSWYHQVLRYEDGRWVRYGNGDPDANPYQLYEDRISMMLDDGSVEGFDRFGGFMTVHQGLRTLPSAASREEVSTHPWLGEVLGRTDVRKFLPQSRDVAHASESSWDKPRDEAQLQALREQGVFIDLWQWRAHRSHPIGYADNGYILDYRHSAEGQGMFVTNWDTEREQPRWMFNAEQTGFHALEWGRLIARGYSQDDPYFLAEGHAIPFDPEHAWQEGDVIPQRLLREPTGSRAAIRADGRWADGYWDVRLTRSLKAPNPLDSKTLRDGGLYQVAFAVHEASGARWHHVSLPLSLGLEVPAEIRAQRVDGPLDEARADWHTVALIRPSQHINWQWLHSDHGGARRLGREPDTRVNDVHDPEGLERRMRLLDGRMQAR